MATYYASLNGDGAHEKVRVAIGWGRSGSWSWAVEISTGEVYDETSETGTRMVRRGEVVDREDLIWRVLMHGRAASQHEAKVGAAEALLSLRKAADAIGRALDDGLDAP